MIRQGEYEKTIETLRMRKGLYFEEELGQTVSFCFCARSCTFTGKRKLLNFKCYSISLVVTSRTIDFVTIVLFIYICYIIIYIYILYYIKLLDII